MINTQMNNTVDFYIASRRIELARQVAEKLESSHLTLKTTSSWLNSNSFGLPKTHSQKTEICVKDLADVAKADIFVSISEPSDEVSRGGRFVEMGYALALGLPIFILGWRENIFCHHPNVIGNYPNTTTLIAGIENFLQRQHLLSKLQEDLKIGRAQRIEVNAANAESTVKISIDGSIDNRRKEPVRYHDKIDVESMITEMLK